MSIVLSLSESQALTALRGALTAMLPSGVEVIKAQQNRVPEPLAGDFVVMTPILRTRLETNTDMYQDVRFTGSASGVVLTVESVDFGVLQTAYIPLLFGPTVTAGTIIADQTSGSPGGAGTYTISKSQTIATGELSAGLVGIKQPVQFTVQLDVHGPSSGDNAQIISTLLRDIYGADLFAASGYDVTPLFAGDPHQAPFQNAEKQTEWRWICDAQLQVNSIVFAPQQFMDTAIVAVGPPEDAYQL
jgi:hypothetical protein